MLDYLPGTDLVKLIILNRNYCKPSWINAMNAEDARVLVKSQENMLSYLAEASGEVSRVRQKCIKHRAIKNSVEIIKSIYSLIKESALNCKLEITYSISYKDLVYGRTYLLTILEIIKSELDSKGFIITHHFLDSGTFYTDYRNYKPVIWVYSGDTLCLTVSWKK